MSSSFRLGFYAGRSALGWPWLGTLTLGVLLALGLAGLLEAQAIGSASSARQTELRLLTGAAFGLLTPLLAFFVSARLGGDLAHLIGNDWARQGADRRVFALGRLAFPALAACVIAGLTGWLALGLSSASSEPALQLPLGLTTRLWAVLGIAALGAASYVAGFSLAQLLGGSFGRTSFLIGDWLLGAGSGVTALPWPRSHLRALLGGEPVLGMHDAQALGCLLALSLAYTLLYAAKIPR